MYPKDGTGQDVWPVTRPGRWAL